MVSLGSSYVWAAVCCSGTLQKNKQKPAQTACLVHQADHHDCAEKMWAIADDITDEEMIRASVLANAVNYGEAEGYVKEWNLNGETVSLGVRKDI